MGWNDRLGLVTDDDVAAYVAARAGRADAQRKAQREAALDRLWDDIQRAPTDGLQRLVDDLERECYGDGAA